jgi:hypothetical protein
VGPAPAGPVGEDGTGEQPSATTGATPGAQTGAVTTIDVAPPPGPPASPGAVSPPPAPMSLLWPAGPPPALPAARLDARAVDDLDLHDVINRLAGGEQRREAYAGRILGALCDDPQVIRYRQAIMRDLLASETLRERLWSVVQTIGDLLAWRKKPAAWSVSRIARRVAELEHYVAGLLELRRALEDAAVRAPGLTALRRYVLGLTDAPSFGVLRTELPPLRATLDRVRSVTIGVNLTQDLTPDSATVLGLDTRPLEGRATLLDRLFAGDGPRGISPLHAVDLAGGGNALYRDLKKLLEEVVHPVADALSRHTRVSAYALTELEPELHFLLCAARLAEALERAGLPVCLPEIAPPEERVTRLDGGYNAALALRLLRAGGQMVTNEIALDAGAARVWILTGPNRGGKTTYTRAVGQAQVLFQAGLCVPGRAGRISPADGVYTHFAAAETSEVGQGRLDEEAARLARIFGAATRRSVVLLNEVLAGTSTVEALGLATDAVRGLRLLGARAVYTTHLHELAARTAALNDETPGDAAVGSLVSVVEDEGAAVIGPRHRRTFRILPGPPRYVSYASEIAEQHGISYGQLVQLFRQRGLPIGPAASTAGRHSAAPAAVPEDGRETA